MDKICLIQDVLIGSLKNARLCLQENILNSFLRKHKRQLKQKNRHKLKLWEYHYTRNLDLT